MKVYKTNPSHFYKIRFSTFLAVSCKFGFNKVLKRAVVIGTLTLEVSDNTNQSFCES
jgi:hypothetical protein